MNSDGSFTEKHADTATGALGEFSMAGSITAPLTMGGYSNNGTTYYAYALGTDGAANVSGMQIITSAANNQNSGRPTLQIRNTWRGYEYSLNGANWTGCGYGDLKLYVLYFESQPTIVTLNEKTIGTAEDMTKNFKYTVTVTETVTTYKRTDTFNRNISWSGSTYTLAGTGTPYQSGSSTSAPVVLPNVNLADREQQAYTLFYIKSQDQLVRDIYSTGSGNNKKYYRDYTYTVTTQTITIVQSTEDEFVTEITEVSDGAAAQNEHKWVYTTSANSDDQFVTYTNTHTPLEVEVHLGIVGADGTITLCDDIRKAPADPEDPYYVLSLDLGGDEKIFLREIPSADLYEAEGYGFAGVYYGTHEGTVITAEGPVSSVTYGKVAMPNIHELYFDGNTSNRKGSYHVYYLYYPMPKMVYVKETSGGALTRISGSLDGTTVADTITYNGASMELNGVTVEQEQRLSVTEDTFAINQGAGFRVLPRLDDGTEKLFLLYTKIGVSGNGSADNTNDLISGSVTDSKAMYLKVDGAQVKWSLNGMTWNAFDGAEPTVYVIYKEIGYDLEITKVVDGASADDTRTFTLTISSYAITESSYAVTGTGYNTISAAPATATAPGTIVLTIRHGSDITVKGLSRGEYTLTESGGAVMSAKIGDEEQTVTDNSMTIADLHENTKVDITNKMPPIAPTGFDFDCHPFVMLLGLGAALALIFKAGRRRRED